jgi:hypothetical protein
VLRFQRASRGLAAASLLALCALGQSDSGKYSHDDGSTEGTIGVGGVPVEFGVLHRFDARGGSDVVTEIRVAFGSPLDPQGAPSIDSPVRVAVYDDPDDDGIPDDLVLLTQASGTIQTTAQDTKDGFPVPPTQVSGVFFVLATMPGTGVPAGGTPVGIDVSQKSNGRAWLTFAIGAGAALNLNDLGANTFPPRDLDTLLIGAPGALLLLDAVGGGAAPTVYCTAKTSSVGCAPRIEFVGVPSANAASGFKVMCRDVIGHRVGLLCYGTQGRDALPFQGGTLCVKAPLQRTPPVSSHGEPPSPLAPCTGRWSIDMNAFAQGLLGGHPAPELGVPGTVVDCQWWGRDGQASFGTSLSDALEYTVGG